MWMAHIQGVRTVEQSTALSVPRNNGSYRAKSPEWRYRLTEKQLSKEAPLNLSLKVRYILPRRLILRTNTAHNKRSVGVSDEAPPSHQGRLA